MVFTWCQVLVYVVSWTLGCVAQNNLELLILWLLPPKSLGKSHALICWFIHAED